MIFRLGTLGAGPLQVSMADGHLRLVIYHVLIGSLEQLHASSVAFHRF